MTNFENSELYRVIEPLATNILKEFSLGDVTHDAVQNASNNLPQVTYDGFRVKYIVPENFEVSEYSSKEFKMYMDDNFNTVTVSVDYDSVETYMEALDDEYVLTSGFYENQKISDAKSYTVNGKEYKFRTITYNDEYGSYLELYFAYELDDEYCYVVEVETEGGISMDTIKNFLDVRVDKNSLQSAIDSERNLGSGNVHINGEETVNVNDIINIYTSDI